MIHDNRNPLDILIERQHVQALQCLQLMLERGDLDPDTRLDLDMTVEEGKAIIRDLGTESQSFQEFLLTLVCYEQALRAFEEVK